MRAVLLALSLALLSCAPAGDVASRRALPQIELPPMKTFVGSRAAAPRRSNAGIARDILDLIFELESGRPIPTLTRFEGPITIGLRGAAPASLRADLDRLVARLRAEAGLDVRHAPRGTTPGITIEVVSRAQLQRAVPQAACFVVPRVASWGEFRRARRSERLDWTTLTVRDRMAVFLPGDVSPQEVRDCLHEEVAQAIGPLNDLYSLSDSVFNDDNFHTVLTGFDMLVLRAIYAPELASGMTREEVAARLPAILERLNPAGARGGNGAADATPRRWIEAIESALGPRGSPAKRRAAAREAVRIAEERGWRDTRAAFSLYALGRLSIGAEPEVAMASFLQSGAIYRAAGDSDLQAAHVGMQLAAFALSAGQAELSIDIVDRNVPAVAAAENAALLSTLLLVKAEALALAGRAAEARAVRQDALGWARYGFGDPREVKAQADEIARLSPARPAGAS